MNIFNDFLIKAIEIETNIRIIKFKEIKSGRNGGEYHWAFEYKNVPLAECLVHIGNPKEIISSVIRLIKSRKKYYDETSNSKYESEDYYEIYDQLRKLINIRSDEKEYETLKQSIESGKIRLQLIECIEDCLNKKNEASFSDVYLQSIRIFMNEEDNKEKHIRAI